MIHTTYISYISYKKDKKKADNIFLLVTLFKILYLKKKQKQSGVSSFNMYTNHVVRCIM